MAETLEMTGFKELDSRLKALPDKIMKNVLRASVGAGAGVIRKEAKMRVPVKSGVLKKAIYSKHIRGASSQYNQTFYVSVRRGKKQRKKSQDAYYWWWVENGTSHSVARPFLRPAFESKKVEAVGAIKKRLLKRLDKFNKTGR